MFSYLDQKNVFFVYLQILRRMSRRLKGPKSLVKTSNPIIQFIDEALRIQEELIMINARWI